MEREISQTLQAKMGRPGRNGNAIFVPTRLRPQATGLDTKSDTAGAYTTQTQVMDLVDALRAQMRLTALGATFLGNLKFSAQFPVEDATSTAHWVGENPGTDVTAGDPSFKSVLAFPKTLQATTSISRQLLQQSSGNLGLEQRLRLDLTRSHAQAFDTAAIAGSGVSNEPIGLLQTPGITVTAINTNGGVPTYATVCDMEAAVAAAGASDSIGWLSTPNVRKLLRKTFTNGTGSLAVWQGDTVLGHVAMVSTNVPADLSKGTTSGTLSAIICGAWAELVLAEFGTIEILADEFAQKRRGLVEITSFSMVDVAIPRPAAFNVCVDAALS